MIDMTDVDGDGLVAFYEFYQLCKEPQPEVPMWRPREEALYRKRDWIAEGGVKNLPKDGEAGGKVFETLDAKKAVEAQKAAEARALELKRKREKKDACEAAVGEAGYRLQELQKAFRKFQRHPDYTTGTLTCEALVEVLSDSAATAKKLFFAYREDDGRCDFREVMLGLAGFVGCTRPQRINFCFYLYDVDNSGNIDKDELLMILKGSQLASSVNYLKSKVSTILSTVEVGADGVIDLERFVIAANRFPNVMFPSFEPAPMAGQGRKKVQLMSPELKQIEKDLWETRERIAEKKAQRQGKGTKLSQLVPLELIGGDGGGDSAAPSTALVPT
jgi:Ca2+-binding EF-hand superfamily protein